MEQLDVVNVKKGKKKNRVAAKRAWKKWSPVSKG